VKGKIFKEVAMVRIFFILSIVSSLFFMPVVFCQDSLKPAVTTDNTKAAQAKEPTPAPQPQAAGEETVKGIIKEIAPDGSYIMVDNVKVITTKELLDESYLEVGDKVEVIAETTTAGLKAKVCNYIFEEEEAEAATAGNTTQ
jgi:hypothetical protein